MHRFTALCGMLVCFALVLSFAQQQTSTEQNAEKKTGKHEETARAQEKEKAPSEPAEKRAENPENRDFRLMTIGPAYQSEEIAQRPDGKYEVKLTAPAKGWSASFVELTYPSGGKYPFKVTTGVKVLPDKYPFPAPANRGSGR